MQLDDDTLYTPPELANIIRHPGTRTLERWRTTGDGPAFVKVGRRVAYTGAAIKDYLHQQTRTHTGEAGGRHGISA